MTPSNPALPPRLVTYSDPAHRSPDALLAVVRQFDVARSERYRPRVLFRPPHTDTFCNIFATDVALAMRVVLPHWVDDEGDPCAVGHGRELAVGGMVEWLEVYGPLHGWGESDEVGARTNAGTGGLSLVTWVDDHVAVLVPGPLGVTTIAQAGASCFESGAVARGFGTHGPLRWWAHFDSPLHASVASAINPKPTT